MSDSRVPYPLTPFERAALIWPMSNELRMEAAMVLWEAVLEAEGEGSRPISALRDAAGTVALRHLVMAHVDALHLGWHVHTLSAGEDALVPFDWEFAPWFLAECLEPQPDLVGGCLTIRTDWLDRCRATPAATRRISSNAAGLRAAGPAPKSCEPAVPLPCR